MEIQFYIEKKNTISQKFPLYFVVVRFHKKAGEVTVRDKGGSKKSERMKVEEFNARFAPVEEKAA